jgi:hypothetical protein
VLQIITQFFLSLSNQFAMMHDAILTWMSGFSSITSHAILNLSQTYMHGLFSGLPAATPRTVTDARSQWIRFFRAMAHPVILSFRTPQKKEKHDYKKKKKKK